MILLKKIYMSHFAACIRNEWEQIVKKAQTIWDLQKKYVVMVVD